MCPFFYQGPRRSRLSDLTIISDILAFTKTNNSEYYHFRLKLTSAANLFCAAKAFAMGVRSAEWTIGVKEHIQSRYY